MENEENWYEDLTDNQIRYLIVIGLVALSIFIFVFRKDIVKNFNWYEQNKEWRQLEFEDKYHGIVFKKKVEITEIIRLYNLKIQM